MPKSAPIDESAEIALRDALLDLQRQLREQKPCAVALIVVGMPSAGRSEVVNKLLEWIDPKYVTVHASEPDALSKRYPPLWRYWNALPPRGQLAIYFLGWYDEYIRSQLLTPKKAHAHGPRMVERIRQLEAMLLADRVRVLKIYLHIGRKLQRERLARLRSNKVTRWRVTVEDRWLAKRYERVRQVMQECLRLTHSTAVPWNTIDGADEQRRCLAVGDLLRKQLQDALQAQRVVPQVLQWPTAGESAPVKATAVAAVISEDDYRQELERLQGRLALLMRKGRFSKRGAVLVFEGMDAAGKGGAIRRITGALDARQYQVVPVSAPTPEEFAHPYLWRFWRRVPSRGDLAIFDRSWYGRVLVERVRDLTAEADWQRAYAEICEFERQLAESGRVVHKFWLAVSKDEQLARLEQRAADPLKRFKVDPEDWANRRCYDAYQIAAREMIERTHSHHAPWTVIDADDKRYARLKVLGTVVEAIADALK